MTKPDQHDRWGAPLLQATDDLFRGLRVVALKIIRLRRETFAADAALAKRVAVLEMGQPSKEPS